MIRKEQSSEYVQEMPQSQTTDQPTAHDGETPNRQTEPQSTTKVKQPALSSSAS